MSRITLLDNPSLTLWYHADTRIIHHEVHQFAGGQALREALTKGAEALEQHGAHKWLSDERKGGAQIPEDIQWSQETWMPRMIKAGWQHWALVLPEKIVGQLSMKRGIAAMAGLGVSCRAFTDPGAALGWLKQQ